MKYTYAILAASLVAACAPQAPVGTAVSPTVVTTAVPTASPTVQPSDPVQAPSPIPSTPAPPAQTWSMENAIPFGNNAPVNPTQVYYESGTGSVYVIDVEPNTEAAPRYMMSKFRVDGSFVSTTHLVLDGVTAPTAVDAMGFQLRGTPILSHRNGNVFQLLKVATATVLKANGYPVNTLQKVGPVALGNDGNILFEAVISLNPDTTERTGGSLYFAHAEEDKAPKALFQIPDPFFPTTRMAFASNGELYLAGTVRGTGIGVKRLRANQALEEVKLSMPTLPDGMWVAPDGDLYLSWNGVATPAIIRRFGPDGSAKGESEVKLKAGGFINEVRGMAFEAQGRIFITGAGFDGAGKSLRALLTF